MVLSTSTNGALPFPLWFLPLFFVAIWIFVAFMLSRVGGWDRLAESYRSDQPFFGTRFNLQAAQLRAGTNYNGCLTFGANHEGLYLRPIVLFRAFHPPLLIPWSEITAKPVKVFRIVGFVELRFQRAPEIPVKIRQSLADKLVVASNGLFRPQLGASAGI